MAFLRGLVWFLGAVALLVVAMYMTGNFEMADRFTALFIQLQPYLPVSLNFDSFLVVLTVFCFLLAVIVMVSCLVFAGVTAARLAVIRQRELAQAAATKREVSVLNDQHHQQYEQLLTISQTLTKRLDKRVLVQGVVEAASRITSVGQANSVVSCWLVHLESDTIRFDMGRYCDNAFFAKTEYQATEQPFARAIASQKTVVLDESDPGRALLRAEKLAQMGNTSGMMVVPMVIEGSVLGFLVIQCHPDMLKSYEAQRMYYESVWSELALGLAIAIQGEVAILDRLTGVHNREYFMKRLIQELERANRFQLPLALLMVDIDNFKPVNDMLGHPQGAAVLKIIAKLIKKEVRAIDLAGRYGGEEFIIMLPETGYGDEGASGSGALVVAERIRKAVDDEFRGMQKPLNLTVSLGVAVRRFPEEREMDYRELIRIADEQLYKAKTTGKNKVCVFQHAPAKESETA